MRALCCALALVFSVPLFAQEKKPPARKQLAKKQAAAKPKAHSKPTPEQIRRFNELQKKG